MSTLLINKLPFQGTVVRFLFILGAGVVTFVVEIVLSFCFIVVYALPSSRILFDKILKDPKISGSFTAVIVVFLVVGGAVVVFEFILEEVRLSFGIILEGAASCFKIVLDKKLKDSKGSVTSPSAVVFLVTFVEVSTLIFVVVEVTWSMGIFVVCSEIALDKILSDSRVSCTFPVVPVVEDELVKGIDVEEAAVCSKIIFDKLPIDSKSSVNFTVVDVASIVDPSVSGAASLDEFITLLCLLATNTVL